MILANVSVVKPSLIVHAALVVLVLTVRPATVSVVRPAIPNAMLVQGGVPVRIAFRAIASVAKVKTQNVRLVRKDVLVRIAVVPVMVAYLKTLPAHSVRPVVIVIIAAVAVLMMLTIPAFVAVLCVRHLIPGVGVNAMHRVRKTLCIVCKYACEI